MPAAATDSVAVEPVAIAWLCGCVLIVAGTPGATVSRNGDEAVCVPSLTVTVIVEDPDCRSAGVTVTVRLAPPPPKVMFATGTRVVLVDAAERVSEPTALSTSPTVIAIAPVEALAAIESGPSAEMVGGSSTGVTVTMPPLTPGAPA